MNQDFTRGMAGLALMFASLIAITILTSSF